MIQFLAGVVLGVWLCAAVAVIAVCIIAGG